MRRLWISWPGLVLVMTLFGACGDSTTQAPTPNPDVEPFVGRWEAESFRIVSVADTTIDFDLFSDVSGGSFTIVVESSGVYTATLAFGGTAFPEIGTLSVAGGNITLRPNGGTPASGPYTFESASVLVVGPASTDFDFNFDNVDDPGLLTFRLLKQ